ncbi:sensor histidine kinase [Sciscionella sediminilitoris]|uniref:sensor histidine kinase n=1 Tax=Sciscionella sediminilitoris TaxID=1445613 RepID=UPI0004DED09B|nr:HAMP domain-containing sensor histidine kinase [Sciscionella sp. SE31]
MTKKTWPPRGLRARLLLAFVVVTVLGAAAAAWSSAGSASGELVSATEQRLTDSLSQQIGAVTPQLSDPPDQATLDRLREAAGPDSLVTYGNLRAEHGAAAGLITGELRTAVRVRARLATQRITADGKPWLLIGTPVLRTEPDGTRSASGVEVYTVHDLSGVQRQVDGITRSAIGFAALTLPLAVLLALLAARGVLGPVRRLRDTARRLASGDLGARAERQGADELAELTGTVNEMAESLQASMARMQRMQDDAKRFASDVSHELRTPLSTLTAVMEVLETESARMQGETRESVQLAVIETNRLVRLVEDLMEVSRFNAGTAELRCEEVDVVAAVRDSVRVRGWLEQTEIVAPERIPARLDRRRLDVILANLIGNAHRHGAPPVRVELSTTAEQLWIEVTDNGPGLSEEVLPHVFDRFYKADAARTRSAGSGLGLAIALENARLHGGELTAGNTGHGARFLLRLPTNLEGPCENSC